LFRNADEGATMEWRRGEFRISDEARDLDIDFVHGELAATYWAEQIPRVVVERSIQNSLNFGIYSAKRQVGFARVVTDHATFAYLADVVVAQPWQAQGLSKWLMEVISAHPRLQGLRRWVLVTADAHGLYEKYGFKPLLKPQSYMEKADPDIYRRAARKF
jgi:N-acetylglutamate synthase-like GNAT family acetyltransferase